MHEVMQGQTGCKVCHGLHPFIIFSCNTERPSNCPLTRRALGVFRSSQDLSFSHETFYRAIRVLRPALLLFISPLLLSSTIVHHGVFFFKFQRYLTASTYSNRNSPVGRSQFLKLSLLIYTLVGFTSKTLHTRIGQADLCWGAML